MIETTKVGEEWADDERRSVVASWQSMERMMRKQTRGAPRGQRRG